MLGLTTQEGQWESPTLFLSIPASPDSVSRARSALEGLADSLPPKVLEDLRLLVSELVTNSIRHTGLGQGDLVELKVHRLASMVRVEVADRGPGFKKQPPKAFSARSSGWGLYLVERLSDRWGLSVGDKTKVWFEIDIPD